MTLHLRKYQVRLNGRNFLIPAPGTGRLAKHGFYSNRFVEANDEREAEKQAVEQLRQRKSLREMVRNSKDDPPRIFLDAMREVVAFEDSADQGLVWYSEESEAGL